MEAALRCGASCDESTRRNRGVAGTRRSCGVDCVPLIFPLYHIGRVRRKDHDFLMLIHVTVADVKLIGARWPIVRLRSPQLIGDCMSVTQGW